MLDNSEVENIGVEAPVKAFSAVPIVWPLALITCREDRGRAGRCRAGIAGIRRERRARSGRWAIADVVFRGEARDELLQLFRILQRREWHPLAQRRGLPVDGADGRGDRQVEDRLGDLDQVLVGEDAVFAGDGRRDALEIERQLDANVLLALVALELLLDVIGGRRLDRAGRRDGRRARCRRNRKPWRRPSSSNWRGCWRGSSNC